MDGIEQIQSFFSPEKFVTICREEFESAAEHIRENIATKRTNSGRPVNSLGLPEPTTGETAASIRVLFESDEKGFSASLVGRIGIWGIDKGRSPSQVQEQFSSFTDCVEQMRRWARAKESRYGLPAGSVNPYSVATGLWERGTILYREGGGTEILYDTIPPVVDNISRRLSELIDQGVFQLLNLSIENEDIDF